MSTVDRLQLMEQGKKRKPRRVRQLSSMRSRNRRIWRRQQGGGGATNQGAKRKQLILFQYLHVDFTDLLRFSSEQDVQERMSAIPIFPS